MTKPPWSRAQDRFADTEPASTLPMIPPGEESAYADTEPMPLANVLAAPAPVDLAPVALDDADRHCAG